MYTNIDTCCVGCLEVKCPYSIEGNVTIELTPDEICKGGLPLFRIKMRMVLPDSLDTMTEFALTTSF